MLEQLLYPQKFLVWCAFSSKTVIGPYFFDASVKHDNYFKMLTDFFWPRYYKSKSIKIVFIFNKMEPRHTSIKKCNNGWPLSWVRNFSIRPCGHLDRLILTHVIIFYGDTLKIKFMQKYLKLWVDLAKHKNTVLYRLDLF